MTAAYDLLLKGGRVIDPARDIDRRLDVAVKDDRIAVLGEDLPPSDAAQVLNVEDALVVPGIIDLHTHVYWGGTWSGVEPEPFARRSGATMLVDAGSSGAGTFPGFLKYVIQPASCRIVAFLNIAFPGLVGALGRVDFPEAGDVRLLNVAEAVRMGRSHPEIIRGIKVRMGRHGTGSLGVTALHMALEAAEILDLPLMAHIDDPPPRVSEVLRLLRPGDILTHAFRRPPNAIVKTGGAVHPAAMEARQRGVRFDIGHGFLMCSFHTARQLFAQGFFPDTISSDVYRVSAARPDMDVATILSKFLALGMSLPDVIRSATATPAAILRMDGHAGTLQPGAPADVSVFRLAHGQFTFQGVPESVMRADDPDGLEAETVQGEYRLEPLYAIVNGAVAPPLTPGRP